MAEDNDHSEQHKSLLHKIFGGYKGRLGISMALAAVLVAWVLLLSHQKQPDPIPKSILSSVSFPVYYPDQNHMPAGFSLNQKTIRYVKPGVVIYSINYGYQNQSVVISEQTKPAPSIISRFISDYIPLHSTFSTSEGTADYGANKIGSSVSTIVSLPVNNGPWIIATAPASMSQIVFEKVIQSLIKS